MSDPKIGFEMKKIRLKLDSILPIRQVKDPEKNIVRYRTIFCSIKEVGLIEPLIVHPLNIKQGTYRLLDGHLRHYALRKLKIKEADCLISIEDESYTYNARISRLSPIQEHKMITRAVKIGVKPERIAATLNLELRYVLSSINLLEGIHPDAVELLKDKFICPKAIAVLKRVTPGRQIEMAELMVSVNNFSQVYADALLMSTPKEHLLNPDKPKMKVMMSPEEVARMESEMEILERDFKAVEESYGENMLNFTFARGYVRKLLDNAKIVRFLSSRYSDLFTEFEDIASAEKL
jgi:hypothetical protein